MRRAWALAAACLLAPALQAATCVQRSPTSCGNDSSIGNRAWSNPANAQGSDSSYASVDIPGGTESQYLKCTGYGFSVPAASVITSIRLGARRFAQTASTVTDHQVRLVKAGSLQSTNVAASGFWPVSPSTNWRNASTSGWTVAQINASNFGQALSATKNPGQPRLAGVDDLPIEVCYDAATGPDHLRITHSSGAGLTCTPSTITVTACADASCSTAYTDGVSGTLSAGSGASVVWPDGSSFSIPAGSSSVSKRVQLTTVGSVVLGVASSTPAALNAVQCNFGSPSCSFSSAAAGMLLSLPNFRAEAGSTLTIAAVRQSDSSLACVPAFANVSRFVNYACSYANPGSGTTPLRLNNQGINSLGSYSQPCASRNLTTAFDSNGRATLPADYADVGQLNVVATYTGSSGNGDAGLVMTGSTQVTVAPFAFAIDTLPSGALTAGTAFGARVQVRTASGALAPNFGRESPAQGAALSWLRRQPTGSAAQEGSFSGTASFTAGVAQPSNLVWSEVGRGDLVVSNSNYLGSGLDTTAQTSASGNTGALGPFRPQHLLVAATAACGAFTYAGQPWTSVSVTARNALGSTTANYDGSANTTPNFARAVSFSNAGAPVTGLSLLPASWPASSFAAGMATASLTPQLASKESGPVPALLLRAIDSEGVSSSASPAEPNLAVKSGRLQLQSASGSAARALALPLRLETWSGRSWALETADSCTPLSPANFVLSDRTDAAGNPTAAWTNAVQAVSLVGGVGSVTLSAPSPSAAGSVKIALNLGPSSPDQACLATPRPSSTGANLPWLRARWGSTALNACNGRWDADPSASASFGTATAESQRRIHERQIY